MTPSQIASLIAVAADLIAALTPALRQLIAGGTVPAERQLAIRQQVRALQSALDSGELGDHWRVDE